MLKMRAISPVGRLLRTPLRLIPRGAILPVMSGVNRGMKWIARASTHGCWLGWYEPELQACMRKLVHSGMVAYDVGANAGFFTLALSRMVEAGGTVVAFEPFAENAANLLRHVALNKLANVQLIQAALSDASGIIPFHVATNNSMGKIGEGSGSYLVPTLTVDEIVAMDQIPAPNLMKIDVEGAESRVLRGASMTIQRFRPIIFLSLHGDFERLQCAAQLRAWGYTVSRLNGLEVNEGEIVPDEILARPAL